MQWVGIIPELGEVLTHYHHMFNKTDTSCCQIKMGMVVYLSADHHMFNKIDTTCNMSIWVWWRTWVQIPKSNIKFIPFQNKSAIVHVCFVLFSRLFVYLCIWISTSKTTIIKQNIKIILLQNNIHMSEVHCGIAVWFGQALPGYLITAHHLYASLL